MIPKASLKSKIHHGCFGFLDGIFRNAQMNKKPDAQLPASMPGLSVSFKNVSKNFGRNSVIKNLTLNIPSGEFVCILGPSGCGKTTLLRILAGLERQDSGEIHIGGKDVSLLPPAARKCGIVFQSYALFPNLSAAENIAYGIEGKMDYKAIEEKVSGLLELIGLTEASDKYPGQLSGGMQQRVALARALAISPSILLLDEPLSALDARVRSRLRGEIRRLQKQLKITTVMVTHDQEEALSMADRVVIMKNGELAQCASPEKVYHMPDSAFVADFIGSMNFLPECRKLSAHELKSYGYTLKSANAVSLDSFKSNELVAAFRPEDAVLLDKTHKTEADNLLNGLVESIEFRGPFYRLKVRLHDRSGNAAVLHFHADVQAGQMTALDLKEGEKASFHIPEKRLIVFEKTQALQV